MSLIDVNNENERIAKEHQERRAVQQKTVSEKFYSVNKLFVVLGIIGIITFIVYELLVLCSLMNTNDHSLFLHWCLNFFVGTFVMSAGVCWLYRFGLLLCSIYDKITSR